MNCREFKKQFEDGLSLSEEATAHLKTCVNCETFHSENLHLSQMIASLPKAEAPKDFEFGFKAKLAQSKLKKPLSPFWQTLRYILPLTAATLIFGLVIINSSLFAPTQTQQTAEKKQETEKKEVPANGNSFEEIQESSNEFVADKTTKTDDKITIEKAENSNTIQDKPSISIVSENRPKSVQRNLSEKDSILSTDFRPETDSPRIFDKDNAFTIPKPINPRGIEPDKKILPKMPQTTKVFTAREILSQLGIETINENGNLKVNSVRQNSAGENSGVKIGDIVTAIDGQTLTNRPLQNRTVQGETLKIKRGDQELNITIRNN